MAHHKKNRIPKEVLHDLALRVDNAMQRWTTRYYRLKIDDVLRQQEEAITLHIDGAETAAAALPSYDLRNAMQSWLRFAVSSAMIFVVGFFVMNGGAYYRILKTSLVGLPELSTTLTEDAVPAENVKPLPLIKNMRRQREQIPPLNIAVLPPDDRLIIPKIGRNIPIIHTSSANLLKPNWDILQKELLQDLQRGVVHFPGTAQAGQKGNMFMTGHSSYYPWDPGKFKDVFALLHKLELGDRIYILQNQKRYVYEIAERKVVAPSDIDVLAQTDDHRLTLMTCTPVGTNLKRLVLVAQLVEE